MKRSLLTLFALGFMVSSALAYEGANSDTIERLKLEDPHGFGISILCMSVVFLCLALLFVFFRFSVLLLTVRQSLPKHSLSNRLSRPVRKLVKFVKLRKTFFRMVWRPRDATRKSISLSSLWLSCSILRMYMMLNQACSPFRNTIHHGPHHILITYKTHIL